MTADVATTAITTTTVNITTNSTEIRMLTDRNSPMTGRN
jgi:hypothetical protein